ncbi:TonB-dependent receptor [Acinetobacter vivianii]|uniref:TonB-dependent receptor n=1 Tax=Acinetobacter vivianii TaxID=1776742 RepID=UPI002DB9B71D|nr:TonB-dependent siderophore receptor [Acinetobacter vivianii]MEB6478386.1 TonB-dependent siderophore receptor [Acinetobacter vivianii]MEB6657783.1 TonB-dependent siderophore receptor [Acinetobacter vivianii]
MKPLDLGVSIKPIFKFSLLTMMMLQAHHAIANEQGAPTAVMPTIKIEAMSELDPIKSYIDYEQASVTRNGLKKKDIPQTIDTIDVQKYKIYGANDLSVMLQGTPGVSTSYDTRGDGISLRGFKADEGDIYRDGVRESGQLRRSTANVERIEILKGPASVLYGRGAGGGVINMVTKFANFDSKSSVGVYAGSYDNIGGTLDFNQVLTDNWAIRLTGEKADTNSFRSGIGSQIEMISPSVTYRSDDEKLLWTTQYTYDKLDRTPDRGPSYENLPTGVSIKNAFARSSDFIEDELQTVRTDVKYEFAPDWKFHWAASYRQAYQNFDNFFGGTYCNNNLTLASKPEKCDWNGYLRQSYAWQETMNKTVMNTFDITGKFKTGSFEHNVMIGSDWTHEDRDPKLGNYSSGEYAGKYYGYINPYNPKDNYVSPSFGQASGRTPMTSYSQHSAENKAIFIQDLISLTPTLKMMLGARYDQFEFKTHNMMTDKQSSYDGETFSPNMGFVWQPVESQSFYTSYSKSFAPYGGRGMISIDPTQNPGVYDAEPQYNEQYEIGVKSDWLNDRLNTQFSIYDITKNNIRYRPDATNFPENWEVGQQQRSRGLEFSFIGRVMGNLFVRGGYGYTDAKWTKDVRSNVPEASRLKDNQLAKVSENTGNLFIRYLPTEKVYGELGATYVGSFYTNDANTAKIEGWTRLDAAIGYKDERWGATVAVNNITDKEYWRDPTMPGTPRNFLVRLNYQF